MGNRCVTADDVVLIVMMTTIMGIMLATEATDIVSIESGLQIQRGILLSLY
jgi:hypothetical protein